MERHPHARKAYTRLQPSPLRTNTAFVVRVHGKEKEGRLPPALPLCNIKKENAGVQTQPLYQRRRAFLRRKSEVKVTKEKEVAMLPF